MLIIFTHIPEQNNLTYQLNLKQKQFSELAHIKPCCKFINAFASKAYSCKKIVLRKSTVVPLCHLLSLISLFEDQAILAP